ncbi:hypothetical protein GCM10023189_32170 [Nibrella saemangeumensis]|uniref:Glycosyl transferase family 11 n=1 Tax=Nibrella saemangeumensis TaxID=1084526 RepID=A0ABP8N4D9_9BACT
MNAKKTLEKVKIKSWQRIVTISRRKGYDHLLYRSFWHYKTNPIQKLSTESNYFTCIPNKYAGIGHQLANWIAGYWFARYFNLNFAHTPFPNQKWESFLGFYENEISVDFLVKQQGYRRVRIPLFDENRFSQIELIKKIISSYSDQKVVFIAEQDQFYHNQYGVIFDLQKKFYNSEARKQDKLIYSKDNFNIAIHIRRGDIAIGQENLNDNLTMRWLDNKYYHNVLLNALKIIPKDKLVSVYLFSQGKEDEFSSFKEFGNVHLCLNMNDQQSFLHMIYADLLITSRSSFSYKPALLNRSIKICPITFWHGYPNTKDWVLAEEDGSFSLCINKQ